MIHAADAHELACRNHPLGHRDVFLGGSGIAAWMIVHQQYRGRIAEQAAFKDVRNVGNGLVDASHADDIEIYGIHFCVEVFDAENLPVILGELLPHDLRRTVRVAHRL